jgi:hypothetical protein
VCLFDEKGKFKSSYSKAKILIKTLIEMNKVILKTHMNNSNRAVMDEYSLSNIANKGSMVGEEMKRKRKTLKERVTVTVHSYK